MLDLFYSETIVSSVKDDKSPRPRDFQPIRLKSLLDPKQKVEGIKLRNGRSDMHSDKLYLY